MKRSLLALVALATVSVTACTDDDPDDPNQRRIDIYSAVIERVATYERPDLTVDEPLDVVVYVAPRENVDINIDVQVGVIHSLEDWADLRFIDEFEEAIDPGDPNQPVRDGSVLIGLGAIPDGPSSVSVLADRYEYADELTTFEIDLRRRAGEWSIIDPIEVTRITLN